MSIKIPSSSKEKGKPKMKNKTRFLIGLVISFVALMVVSQPALAFTYPSSRHSSSSSPTWLFILIIIVVAAFLGIIIYQRRKAKPGSAGPGKVSSIVQDKLVPGENVIRQLSNGKADFVATDKRLLRFSGKGFEQLNYTDIAAVNYKTSGGKKAATRVLIGVCLLIMLGITVGIWAAAFSSSVRNVSKLDAVIVTIVAVGIGIVGFLAMSRDFGFYQIESKQGVITDPGSWRIVRPPAYLGNANVEEFAKTIKERLVA
jgi:protein-S-isoprenylcysteine O-methyltransferase Ste14